MWRQRIKDLFITPIPSLRPNETIVRSTPYASRLNGLFASLGRLVLTDERLIYATGRWVFTPSWPFDVSREELPFSAVASVRQRKRIRALGGRVLFVAPFTVTLRDGTEHTFQAYPSSAWVREIERIIGADELE